MAVTGEELFNFYRDWYVENGADPDSIDPWGADPRDCCMWDDMATFVGETPPLVLTGLKNGFTGQTYVTGTRQKLKNVHYPIKCEGDHCVIHNPSNHPLKDAPTHWRRDHYEPRKGEIMERICPHGLFHPDPDDLAFVARTLGQEEADLLAEHDCCGCCKEKA